MKWYKRDPDAALTGMRGLPPDEFKAYSIIIDLLYSRDGHLPDDEHLLCVHIECRPQWWRRVRASLIARGKIWITVDRKIMANRVETTLKQAANFGETQSKRATIGWVSRQKVNNINSWPMQSGNANTTTTRSTTTSYELGAEEKKADDRGSKQASAALEEAVRAKDWKPPPKPSYEIGEGLEDIVRRKGWT